MPAVSIAVSLALLAGCAADQATDPVAASLGIAERTDGGITSFALCSPCPTATAKTPFTIKPTPEATASAVPASHQDHSGAAPTLPPPTLHLYFGTGAEPDAVRHEASELDFLFRTTQGD